MPGIFTSRMARSGWCVLDQLDGLVAAPGLAHDLVALFFEGLLEIEADDGLVFSDHDTDGHRLSPVGSGRRTREGSAGFVSESIEQLVLFAFELFDRGLHLGSMAFVGVSVALCLVVLPIGQRRLGHQAPGCGRRRRRR